MTPQQVDKPPGEAGASPIFRREALEHRAQKQGEGDVVRIAPRWTTWSFYMLIALLAAGLVAASVVEIDRYVPGATATDDRGRVVVLLPAALAPRIAPGSPVELEVTTTEVVATEDAVLQPADVRDRYGIDVFAPSVALVTSASGEQHARGSARVLVESEPVIIALVPGLKSLFGDG